MRQLFLVEINVRVFLSWGLYDGGLAIATIPFLMKSMQLKYTSNLCKPYRFRHQNLLFKGFSVPGSMRRHHGLIVIQLLAPAISCRCREILHSKSLKVLRDSVTFMIKKGARLSMMLIP